MDIVEEFLEVSKVVAWLHCAISKLCDIIFQSQIQNQIPEAQLAVFFRAAAVSNTCSV